MKRSYIKIILVLSISSVLFYACKKEFLERAPLGSLDQGNLTTSAGVRGLLIGAYSLLDGYGGAGGGFATAASNWVFGGVASDDAYKGSDPGDQADIVSIETYSANASNPYFESKWRHLYDAIQRSNDVLRVMADVKGMSDTEKKVAGAEARFLRAHYHFEAKRMWNMIPYVDETITYAKANILVANDKDIWPNIEADLKFAVANLPATQPAIGRANSWAAKAYLAKVYLYQKKYAEAKTLLDDVITNGTTASGKKYDLVNFFDNFNPETKNSVESVFSAQMSVNDNSGGSNGNWGDVLNFPYNGGPGGCCGFYQPSQSLVNSYRVDTDGLPFLDNFNSVDVKNDQGLKSDDPFTPETAPLDPRLDITVGRRGIPYLDWGVHPGNNWIRDQANGGPYAPKKSVYAKRQQGALTDKSFWSTGITANNYTIIRFADVLLMAAEAEVEVGSLDKAKDLVNRVRQRAAAPEGWVKTYVDPAAPEKGFTSTPAANYKIGLYPAFPDKVYARKAVRFERKLELAMEGSRFFDLVRYGTAAEELNAYIAVEKNRRSYLNNASFTKAKNEYFPIPRNQIDLSKGTLKQNPGY
ncbi:RagB/SusD family nutrient uptake outer membrane protein [Daejeonella sp. H1SJ63]|uniref:RagB/SusD family nutrient uptake outer membrane protein n=1 Tax=Daejeonella sp. H1SJ63 TaxID=3034145 RepID=UPI0023EC6BEB|nr:RagB/SusD family nutrient uptake outer membrane protein [Daejeonella sp. H1SJ63]